jgi:hypothetical protein
MLSKGLTPFLGPRSEGLKEEEELFAEAGEGIAVDATLHEPGLLQILDAAIEDRGGDTAALALAGGL